MNDCHNHTGKKDYYTSESNLDCHPLPFDFDPKSESNNWHAGAFSLKSTSPTCDDRHEDKAADIGTLYYCDQWYPTCMLPDARDYSDHMSKYNDHIVTVPQPKSTGS